jgi:hypothetical protein
MFIKRFKIIFNVHYHAFLYTMGPLVHTWPLVGPLVQCGPPGLPGGPKSSMRSSTPDLLKSGVCNSFYLLSISSLNRPLLYCLLPLSSARASCICRPLSLVRLHWTFHPPVSFPSLLLISNLTNLIVSYVRRTAGWPFKQEETICVCCAPGLP